MAPSTTDPPLPDWFPYDQFPFAGRFMEVDGHRLHYVDEGAGPTLVLLHGNPTWSFLYRKIILGLRDRFRCLAVDYPGFGLSQAADGYDFHPASHAAVVEQWLEKLGVDRFGVMVQDWGGPIGFSLAGRHPERIEGLVIGNTWAWPITGDKHFERFSDIMGGTIGRFAIRHFNAFVNVMIPKGITRGKVPPEVLHAYRAPFPTPDSRLPTNIFPRQISHGTAFLTDVEKGLPGLRDKPALIVWGDRDIAFRAKERARFEVLFPRHRTEILAGAGHFIQEDAPEEIVAAIRAWWDAEGIQLPAE